MSGHSKWSTIKRKKGAADAARGKLFTRLIRELSVAAREGGGDPEANPRLRTALKTAKASNMPNDNIDRAIKKGTGELEGFVAEEILYEGYGPFGVAVLLETYTDNRNRTGGEIRFIFTKCGGNLGEIGSVNWMFDRKGIILVDRREISEDDLLEAALDCGADDVETEGDPEYYRILVAPKDLHLVYKEMEKMNVPVGEASLDRIPKTTKELNAKEAEKFLKFFELLEDQDDVQKVYANFEISDEVMEKLSS